MSRLTTERKNAFWKRHKSPDGRYYCEWCDRQVYREAPENAADKATIDHIVARALGGEDKKENLVVSCRPCNQEKAKREHIMVQKLNVIMGVIYE